MSPTYTMSAHLCKQVYTSWRQARQGPPSPTADGALATDAALVRRSPSPEKRSMDSDRGDAASTAPSSPAPLGWRWGSR